MTTPLRKAVIPAAGLGTRFLPVTKASPKEMLPVVDKPVIQYVVEEAVAAGLTDILIVTSREKRAIEDHFDRAFELEAALERKGRGDDLRAVRDLASLARIHFVRQGEALGLGHAVSVAREHVGDEAFAVLLGDDLMTDARLLDAMMEVHHQRGGSVVALKSFPPEEISAYGVADVEAVDGAVHRVRALVEKPPAAEAPSDLGIIGRYVLTPDIFEVLATQGPGAGGEIQLTDALAAQLHRGGVWGYRWQHGRYDTGRKVDYLRANLELALEREDLGAAVAAMLAEVVRHRL